MKNEKVANNNDTEKDNTINLVKIQSDCEKHFGNCVKKLKEKHEDNIVSVNLLSDASIVRAVAAWPMVPREVRLDATEKENPWDMVWYAPGVWMEAALIPPDMERSVMLTVKQNHLVYPDGDMPRYVRAYLVRRGKRLVGISVTDEEDQW